MTATARPLVALVAGLAIACVMASSAEAVSKQKYCGTTSAAGVTMRVTIYNEFRTRFIYSCATARGVMRAYARTRPTQRRPLGTVRYAGRRWECYFIRDSSGYSCSVGPVSNYKLPRIGSRFV